MSKLKREEAEKIVKQRGGRAGGSVSKQTSYLVAGENAGSKLTKAQELKIPVVTEDEFLEMLMDKPANAEDAEDAEFDAGGPEEAPSLFS